MKAKGLPEGEEIVSMLEFSDTIFVATKKSVYYLARKMDMFIPIAFEVKEDET